MLYSHLQVQNRAFELVEDVVHVWHLHHASLSTCPGNVRQHTETQGAAGAVLARKVEQFLSAAFQVGKKTRSVGVFVYLDGSGPTDRLQWQQNLKGFLVCQGDSFGTLWNSPSVGDLVMTRSV